jgi:hypothetical protein
MIATRKWRAGPLAALRGGARSGLRSNHEGTGNIGECLAFGYIVA